MSVSNSDDDSSQDSRKIRNAVDLQRLQLEKLMKNPEKEVILPYVEDEKKPRAFEPHEFVRNVMGASAGAGSGEFDIYRGCRRRQMIREEFIKEQAEKQKIQDEFEKKRLENQKAAEEKTAKKRQKRLKRKQKNKAKKTKSSNDNKTNTDSQEDDQEEEEEEIDLKEIEKITESEPISAKPTTTTTTTTIKSENN